MTHLTWLHVSSAMCMFLEFLVIYISREIKIDMNHEDVFKLRLKRIRWADDNPRVLALQFSINVVGYQNEQFFKLFRSKTVTFGTMHQYGAVQIPPGYLQSVVGGQFAIRYLENVPLNTKQSLYDLIISQCNSLGECDITLQVRGKTALQPVSSFTYADWLPPRKIFVEFTTPMGQNHLQGLQKMKQTCVNRGFGFLDPIYESFSTFNLAEGILKGIPHDLRPCDVIIIYVCGFGSYLTSSDNEKNGAQDATFMYSNNTDNDIRNAICARKYNGANVTFVMDTHVTDLTDALCNIVPSDGKFVDLNLRQTRFKWPREVKVIHASSATIDPIAMRGSYTFQSSWLAEGIIQTLNKTQWKLTYRELLQGIKDFYASLSFDKLEEGDKHCCECVQKLTPMLGCASLSNLNDPVFQGSAWAPKRQTGAIKKAVLVGVDCWTNGKARAVTNGFLFAPYIASPRNDTYLMYKLLTEKLGFLPQNVAVLRNQPNKASVLRAIDWLMSDNVDGNELVFYFSGHGTNTLDHDGDEIDSQDEYICLQDGIKLELMSDDEIYASLLKRNTQKCALWCVFDSCHSGTIGDPSVRYACEDGATVKSYTDDTRRTDPSPPKNTYVLCATSDELVTYEFNPRKGVPDPPQGLAWEYMPNPPFSAMMFYIWRVMEDNKWEPIKIKDILVELKKRYAGLVTQSASIPTLGSFQELTEDVWFLGYTKPTNKI